MSTFKKQQDLQYIEYVKQVQQIKATLNKAETILSNIRPDLNPVEQYLVDQLFAFQDFLRNGGGQNEH